MAIHKNKLSPRQKMINLMYVVLMAMLALNVSSDVLNGFKLVDEMLDRSVNNIAAENKAILADLEKTLANNPGYAVEWQNKIQKIKKESDDLFNYVEELKWLIVSEADGNEADLRNIQSQENLEAATYVMLSPESGQGQILFDKINQYRNMILKMIADPEKKKNIADNLSTELPERGQGMGKNWQEYMFENVPVSAAVVLLSKIQDDVLYAEGEALHEILSSTNVNEMDLRVNDLKAYVIPNSRTLNVGDTYSAQVVVAAVDTTSRPEIYVGNSLLQSGNGKFQTICNSPGEHSFSGYVVVRKRDGSVIRRNFLQTYNVLPGKADKIAPETKKTAELPAPKATGGDDEEKTNKPAPKTTPHIGIATVSATLMNVLYAGFENPISISVSGATNITASMTGGSFHDHGNGKYTAVPSTVGQDVTISVSATVGGRSEHIGDFPFHVRKLPDPTPYFKTGADDHFKGGAIAKQTILGLSGIHAAIDDGLLNIPFSVSGFEMVSFDRMGNAIPLVSNSSSFTAQQKDQIRDMQRGKRFYITKVHATGPDKIARVLPGAMEVIVR